MIQTWIPNKALTLNFPGWSLSVEMFFYISFPFLLNHVYSKYTLKNNAILIFLIWLFTQAILHFVLYGIIKTSNTNSRDMLYFPLMHFNEFLIGNLTGLFFIKEHKNIQKKKLSPIYFNSDLLAYFGFKISYWV